MATIDPSTRRHISLGQSLLFLLRHPTLLGTSLALFAATALITWAGYHFSVTWISGLFSDFFTTAPTVEHFWYWPLYWGWSLLKWLLPILSRVVAFYLAFLLAYTLTAPGYSFLSNLAGNRFTRQAGEGEAALTPAGVCKDLLEGLKTSLFGVLVTIFSLMLSLVPVLGHVLVFCISVFYICLMFLDFPASRYSWSLGHKLSWLWHYRAQTFRMGLLPTLVGMIPLANVFLMALCFPLFTVYITLNFLLLEDGKNSSPQIF